jgi:hypothetical protein
VSTRYINTDLDLEVACDLGPLAAALEAKDIFPLHITQKVEGCWSATFECVTFRDDVSDTPDTRIGKMLDVVESLQGEASRLWLQCSRREFNLGYDCGDTPFSFYTGLTNSTLLRVAGVGASIGITLYGVERSPS